MKRQIKFRGKRVDTGEWVIGCLVGYHQAYYDGNSNRVCIVSGILTTTEVISDTVGQFTGLLDKNGKEIYEGDILKSSLTIGIPNTGCCHEIGELFVVVCMPSGYTLVSMRDYRYESRRSIPSLSWNLDNYFIWNHHNDFEVVGNVFDNHELLKGCKE